MSIIQDALKKAESCSPPTDVRPKIEQAAGVRGLKPAIKQAAQNSRKPPALKKHLLTAAALSTIILAVSIFFVVQFILKNSTKPNNASAASPQQVSYKPIVKDAVDGPGGMATSKILKAAKPPDLVLNGIMYLEEGPRALINNYIVETGESVSGAKVKEINRQSVILEYENVEITLSLK